MILPPFIGVHVIRDSSDSNPRFYIVTCAGESQSALHIEKWDSATPAALPTFYNFISRIYLPVECAQTLPRTCNNIKAGVSM